MAKLQSICKRLLSLLLLASVILGLMPSIMIPKTEAAESWDVDGDGTLSFLAIGNSFSVDALQYVYQIANSLGITSIHLGNLYIGGCTLATHWTNANGDLANYTYYTNTAGTWSSVKNHKMSAALTSRSWDYISMQQASPNSGQENTYDSNLTNLVSYVKNKCPNTKLVWHMTWAYQKDSSHSGFSNYSKNQTTMYNSIVSATKNKIANNPDFSIIIPNGTAIQNVRTSLIGDLLTRDGYHLNLYFGRYIAGLMVVKQITGLNVANVNYKPDNVPNVWKDIAVEAVNNAYNTPYSVTNSTHTDVTKESGYTVKKVQLIGSAYWHSANANFSTLHTKESNSPQYYATNPRYKKSDLPTGCVITVASGWQYRPDAWRTDTKQNSANRPTPVTTSRVVVTDEWWMYDKVNQIEYVYRAFNISKTGTPALTGVTAATVNSNFKIYIPKEYVTESITPESILEKLNGNTYKAPVPNNKLFDVTNANHRKISGKFIFVSDPKSNWASNSTYYALDPTTPRLFRTFHASKVTITSDNRVKGADPSWALEVQYKSEITTSTTSTWGVHYCYVKIPDNTLDSKALYIGLTKQENGLELYPGTSDANYKRPVLFANYDGDRFHLCLDNTRIDNTLTTVRTNFIDPGSDDPYFTTTAGKAVENTPVAGKYVAFKFYKLIDTMVNVEPLYAEIQRARNYLNVDPTYSPGYLDYLTALNAAVDDYIYYNGRTNSSAAVTTTAQKAIDTDLSNLKTKTNALNAFNKVSNLAIPYTTAVSGISSKCNNGKLEGTYFISRQYNGNIDGVYSFMDPNYITSGDVGIQRLHVEGGLVNASDLSLAVTLHYVEGSTNKYTMELEDKRFYRLSGADIALGSPYGLKFKVSEYNANYVSIESPTAANTLLYCDAASSKQFDWSMEKNSVWNDDKNRVAFRLYQCSPTTLELYRTLKFIQPYLDPNEAVKRYPNEIYQQFLSYVSTCCSKYATYNTSSNTSNADAKKELEEMAAQLRQWVTTLTNADATANFIEIPMEILDFRADTLLMEWYSNYYTLSNSAFDSGTFTNIPGQSVDPDLTDSYTSTCRQGLISTGLVDGQIVYTPETIGYVAMIMKSFDDSGTSTTASSYRNSMSGVYQKDLRAKLEEVKNGAGLGNLPDTINKTIPNENGIKENGCILPWQNITTLYDLSYYLLTNLWREVDSKDTLPSGSVYNQRVPERDTLRLYKDSTGMYTIASQNNMIYDGYSIYNSVPFQKTVSATDAPLFTPIDGLGFEAGGAETDRSTYFDKQGYDDAVNGTNFHYSIHAYGSFVYYADQNLEFSFLGDDDVYFFINGQLAMDIGGAHTPVGATLKLNSKASTFGLVDGQICTFDMFYAERHTTGANMKFSTNINIVDTDTITTKGQYLQTDDDTSMNDTGMGVELTDNALVNIGDTVIYSFEVLNTRDVPLYNLSFSDNSIGSHISYDGIALCDIDLANGVETTLGDLSLYYRTVNDDTLHNGDPQSITYEEILAMINKAKNESTSLPSGSYRVTVSTDDELQELLRIGVPTNCQLSVYGFKRKTIAGDRPYENTVNGRYYYLPNDANATEEDAREVTGSASRIVQVPDPSSFILPTASKELQVLDFGKPLSIPYSKLKERFTVGGTGNVQIGDFVGITTTGYHGAPLRRLPADLSAVPGASVESKPYAYVVDNGVFTATGTDLIFTPDVFMANVDTVYAVYAMSGCHGMLTDGTSVTYDYIQLELTLLPATNVYYETDFNPNLFTFTHVKDGKEHTPGWSLQVENPDTADPYQEYMPDAPDTFPTYGKDAYYDDDSYLSNGSSYYVNGLGVNSGGKAKNYTEVSFTFKGTGFDLISRTGPSQATIRTEVARLSDGNIVKTISMNNKGELQLFQIPVISVNDLPYDEYVVTVWVSEAVTYEGVLEFLSRGGDFYFDALRIYDPIPTDKADTEMSDEEKYALNVYCRDGEAYPYVEELRNLLLSKQDFDALTDEVQGVLYLDTTKYEAPSDPEGSTDPESPAEPEDPTAPSEPEDPTTPSEPEDEEDEIGANNHLSVNAATYEKLGPKNEIYLAPGQSIAMEVTVVCDQTPVSFDIGAKSILGDSGTLVAGFLTEDKQTSDIQIQDSAIRVNVGSATAQYFALDHSAMSSGKAWLVIYNGSEITSNSEANIISITDIKVAFDSKPNIDPPMKRSVYTDAPVIFSVNSKTKDAAQAFILGEAETPIHKTDMPIMHSLNLASDISLNYVVEKEYLDAYDSFRLEVKVPNYAENQLCDYDIVELDPIDNGTYYYFILEGLTAINMGDIMEATLKLEKDGIGYTSQTDLYSIAQYAYSQLAKSSASESLKTLCANLLRYGSTAQIYKGYRTDALVDTALTEAQQAYLTDTETVTFANTNVTGTEISDPAIHWFGKTLELNSKVGLKFVFSTRDYDGAVEDLTLRISYEDLTGKPCTAVIDSPIVYSEENALYAFLFDGLTAAELRQPVTVQIFKDNIPLSCTMRYSADTYGNNKQGALGNLCKALFAYSDSAKAFFAE